jgi:hypothetical protein
MLKTQEILFLFLPAAATSYFTFQLRILIYNQADNLCGVIVHSVIAFV